MGNTYRGVGKGTRWDRIRLFIQVKIEYGRLLVYIFNIRQGEGLLSQTLLQAALPIEARLDHSRFTGWCCERSMPHTYPDIQGAASPDHLLQLTFSDQWFGPHAFYSLFTIYCNVMVVISYTSITPSFTVHTVGRREGPRRAVATGGFRAEKQKSIFRSPTPKRSWVRLPVLSHSHRRRF